ncbi:hypothetical protein CEXT_619331 [Caerostris extrusa]|uniref:Uncharacterized protein n=1 Tax=Caerostris extrusa TaxID=172846 RepID=A0AAV4ULJ1_CAEEX|nr:hypothetical protein CEXT_619331 [Caerostris extrusa]
MDFCTGLHSERAVPKPVRQTTEEVEHLPNQEQKPSRPMRFALRLARCFCLVCMFENSRGISFGRDKIPT